MSRKTHEELDAQRAAVADGRGKTTKETPQKATEEGGGHTKGAGDAREGDLGPAAER